MMQQASEMSPKKATKSPKKTDNEKPGDVKVQADLDWADTPIYRQHILKQSEEEALQDTEVFKNLINTVKEERSTLKGKSPSLKKAVAKVLLNKRRQAQQKANGGQYDLDSEDEALERATKLVLSEGEINYLLEVLKRRQRDPLAEVIKVPTLRKYFERAQFTFEVVMEKLALSDVCQKLIFVYK